MCIELSPDAQQIPLGDLLPTSRRRCRYPVGYPKAELLLKLVPREGLTAEQQVTLTKHLNTIAFRHAALGEVRFPATIHAYLIIVMSESGAAMQVFLTAGLRVQRYRRLPGILAAPQLAAPGSTA